MMAIDYTLLNEILNATGETVYMVFTASFISSFFGLFLGILLFYWQEKNLGHCRTAYSLLNTSVNIGRSLPFIILLIAILPLTRLIIGTTIGVNAAIVPLTIGAIPFVARLVESSFRELSLGLIETGLAMGATKKQIIFNMLLPEALTSIVNGITLVVISLVGYSAMAGTVGGGGLGDLAIRYGYQRFDVKIMVITIAILIVLVQAIQWIGDQIAQRSRYL